MNWHAILVICGLAVIVGVLLYLPFFIWFRWRRSEPGHGAFTSVRVTGVGLCLYGVVVLVLFAGFAAGQIAPQSWFGSQLRTLFGGIGYMTTVLMASSVVERVLVKRGLVFSYRMVSSPNPDALAPNGSENEAREA
jgi:hypothetical protein